VKTKKLDKNQKIVIYKTPNNKVEFRVQLEHETVWLDQKGIATLFDVNIPAISKHISNIINDKELTTKRTISKMEIVQKEGQRTIKRSIDVFNLDMIISIGYRVNSKRATQFRIWATNILQKYIVNGYALNRKRLEQESKKYLELKTQVQIMKRVIEYESLTLDQSKELIRIISDYKHGFEMLDQVDKKTLSIPRNLTKKKLKNLNYKSANKEIEHLRKKLKASELFGSECNDKFISIIQTIFQTYNNVDLYPSLEEKAANLLYMLIKDHPFIDGNKRIGSFMFIRFLDINGQLYRNDMSKILEENTLVAIALLIAQSDPKDKDLMVKLILNMLVRMK
jgi:prophage maintenance system killer protein/predicted XRE-type DNA-binding protein